MKSRVIDKQVQLKDLFHTILHLTGIPRKENKFFNLTKSIIYQINNKSTPKYIFGEYLKTNEGKEIMINRALKFKKEIKNELINKILSDIYYICSSQTKYITYKNQIEEIYDLKNDPHEQNGNYHINENEIKSLRKITEFNIKRSNKAEELKNIVTEKEKTLIRMKIKNIDMKKNSGFELN